MYCTKTLTIGQLIYCLHVHICSFNVADIKLQFSADIRAIFDARQSDNGSRYQQRDSCDKSSSTATISLRMTYGHRILLAIIRNACRFTSHVS